MRKKLRNCNAYVLTDNDANFIRTCYKKKSEDNSYEYSYYVEEHTLIALVSYNSLVAVFDCDTDTLFLLPRWNYSITTQSHIRKFIEDYLNTQTCKHDLINNLEWFETIFIDTYDNGSAFLQSF